MEGFPSRPKYNGLYLEIRVKGCKKGQKKIKMREKRKMEEKRKMREKTKIEEWNEERRERNERECKKIWERHLEKKDKIRE